MKKVTVAFFLVALMSISTLADGDLPGGSRSCPNGQTTCLVGIDNSDQTVIDKTLILVKKFLTDIFG